MIKQQNGVLKCNQGKNQVWEELIDDLKNFKEAKEKTNKKRQNYNLIHVRNCGVCGKIMQYSSSLDGKWLDRPNSSKQILS